MTNKDNDKWNVPFINETLRSYLENEEYKQYKTLILELLRDDINPAAKWCLWNLFMNHGTNVLTIDILTKTLKNVYCSDENIAAYVKDAVKYNPKLGYISISAKSGTDMEREHSLDIYMPCSPSDPEKVEKMMAQCREVLTMMLVEAKTVPYEKISAQNGKT